MRLRADRIALIGMQVAVGIILSYLEYLFIIPVGIPGVKVGFSNLVSVLSLYLLGPLEAGMVLFLRVVLSGLLFGTGYGILYSCAGALLSYVTMLIIYKNKHLSVVGVSAVGGVCHNIGQLIVAGITVKMASVIYYLPMLVLSGVIAGTFIGIVSRIIIGRLKYIINKRGV